MLITNKGKHFAVGILVILFFLVAFSNKPQHIAEQATLVMDKSSDSANIKLKVLSEILKDKLQQLGQLSCEIAKDDTSVNGG